jgi:hypothetical protein
MDAIDAIDAIDTGILWENIPALMAEEDWQERTDGEPGEARYLYLGTVFTLTPSGKFYMPWACGNVTEEEAQQDEKWYDAVRERAEGLGYSFESGEGDPCDLFLVEYRDAEEEA